MRRGEAGYIRFSMLMQSVYEDVDVFVREDDPCFHDIHQEKGNDMIRNA